MDSGPDPGFSIRGHTNMRALIWYSACSRARVPQVLTVLFHPFLPATIKVCSIELLIVNWAKKGVLITPFPLPLLDLASYTFNAARWKGLHFEVMI